MTNLLTGNHKLTIAGQKAITEELYKELDNADFVSIMIEVTVDRSNRLAPQRYLSIYTEYLIDNVGKATEMIAAYGGHIFNEVTAWDSADQPLYSYATIRIML